MHVLVCGGRTVEFKNVEAWSKVGSVTDLDRGLL